MSNKDYQNGFIAGAVSGGVVEVIDTTEIDNLEDLIRNSGLFEEGEYTLTEKIQRLIDMIKEYQNNNPEISVPESILKSLEGYLLKDKDGLYLTTKENE